MHGLIIAVSLLDHLSLSCSRINPLTRLFQFLTFAERLANVNIDVIHRIDRTGSYAEVCKVSVRGTLDISPFPPVF